MAQKIIQPIGKRPHAAPMTTEFTIRPAGMRYTASATTTAAPRPINADFQAGTRITPRANKSAKTGMAATSAERPRLPATGSYDCCHMIRSILSQLHRLAAGLFAALRGVEEGEDLERLVVGDRRMFRLHEFHDLLEKLGIAGVRQIEDLRRHVSALAFRLAKSHGAVVAVRAQCPSGTDTAVFPASDDDVGIGRRRSRDLFAACAHDGVERLDGMDCVPRQIELMMFFEWSGAPRRGAFHQAGARIPRLSETQAGGAEPRHAGIFRKLRDGARVIECGCERLIDEDRLVARHGLARLRKMGATVDAFDQDAIHQAAKIGDSVDDSDAPFLAQLFREVFDARAARFDVGASAFERGDNAGAGRSEE